MSRDLTLLCVFQAPKTPLQKSMDSLGKQLSFYSLCIIGKQYTHPLYDMSLFVSLLQDAYYQRVGSKVETFLIFSLLELGNIIYKQTNKRTFYSLFIYYPVLLLQPFPRACLLQLQSHQLLALSGWPIRTPLLRNYQSLRHWVCPVYYRMTYSGS